MPETVINTGNKALDADLRVVFDANSPKRRQEIKSAIANYDLSRAQLFEIVPEAIFRVVVGLRNPTFYRDLLERVREDARPHLEKAREIADQHFADILKHPALMLSALTPGEDDDDVDHQFDSEVLRSVEMIRHMPLWAGKPPQMRPASRVAFFGADKRLLLDSVFDWYDYLYVITTLTGMLVCEMDAGRRLAELGHVKLPYKKKMEESIQKLEDGLARIKELVRLYGLNAGVGEPIVREKAD